MSKEFMGYGSRDEYVAAIEEELGDHGHFSQGSPAQRQREQRHSYQPERNDAHRQAYRDPNNPKKALPPLRGEPGSKERWRYVREVAGQMSPELGKEARQLEAAVALDDVLNADEINPYEVARLVLESDDPVVYGAVRNFLDESWELDEVDELVVGAVRDEIERQDEAELSRLAQQEEQRKQAIRDELERMAPEDREAVLDYVPIGALDEENAVLQARAVEVVGRSQRAGLRKFQVHSDIVEELKRVGAPGSSWNDSERAEWEAEMNLGPLQSLDSTVLHPGEAVGVAIASMQPQRPLAPYAEAILEELHSHTYEDQPEHMSEERVRERNPEDYIPTGEPGSSASPQLPERRSYAE